MYIYIYIYIKEKKTHTPTKSFIESTFRETCGSSDLSGRHLPGRGASWMPCGREARFWRASCGGDPWWIVPKRGHIIFKISWKEWIQRFIGLCLGIMDYILDGSRVVWVWNTDFLFLIIQYLGNNHPNWLPYVSGGCIGIPPTRYSITYEI